MRKYSNSQIEHGEELIAWEINDHLRNIRGFWWYVIAVIAVLALLIFAIRERNFLFAFIIIMFVIIFATHSIRPPVNYRFSIHETGIYSGSRFYPWKDVEEFWIAYEPPAVKTLYLEFGGLRPRMGIHLEDVDPNEARNALTQFIPENSSKTEEPVSDWITRVLKI